MKKILFLAVTAAILTPTAAPASADFSPDVVQWGEAATACLARPTHAAAACYVTTPRGAAGLAIYCPPPITESVRSIADGCDAEATREVAPARWTPE